MVEELPTAERLTSLVARHANSQDLRQAITLYPALLKFSRDKRVNENLKWCLDCFTTYPRARCDLKTIAKLQDSAKERSINAARVIDEQLVPILRQLQKRLTTTIKEGRTLVDGDQLNFNRSPDNTIHELESCTLRAERILPEPKSLTAGEKRVRFE